METAKKNETFKFLMSTDWLFKGTIDSEQKKYVLLSYFQKLNQQLEEHKLFPMFTELSLHLGNVQNLINKNQIIYTDKKFRSLDDELVITDIKEKNIPELNEEEYEEYKKILSFSQVQLMDYFNIVKTLFFILNEKIDVVIKKNRKNVGSNIGFVYFIKDRTIYTWKYSRRKISKLPNQYKIKFDLIMTEELKDLTIMETFYRFLETTNIKNGKRLPVWEIKCQEDLPLKETLFPILKRKVMSYINQSSKPMKALKNGVQ